MENILGESEPAPPRKLTRAGKIILGVCGASFVAITALTTPFLVPAMRRYCLPYVPATREQIRNVAALLEKGGATAKKGALIDLGSGDGRIVSNRCVSVL